MAEFQVKSLDDTEQKSTQEIEAELLTEHEDDYFRSLEVAEKLKLQLKKLELIRILSDQMLKKKD